MRIQRYLKIDLKMILNTKNLSGTIGCRKDEHTIVERTKIILYLAKLLESFWREVAQIIFRLYYIKIILFLAKLLKSFWWEVAQIAHYFINVFPSSFK